MEKFKVKITLEEVQKMMKSVKDARQIVYTNHWEDDNMCYEARDTGIGIDWNWETQEYYLGWERGATKNWGTYSYNTYPDDDDAAAKIHKDANTLLKEIISYCQERVEKCKTVKDLKDLYNYSEADVQFCNRDNKITFGVFKNVSLNNIMDVDVIVTIKGITYEGRIFNKKEGVIWHTKKYKDEIIHITDDKQWDILLWGDEDDLPF